jgi:hypothetical protein
MASKDSGKKPAGKKPSSRSGGPNKAKEREQAAAGQAAAEASAPKVEKPSRREKAKALQRMTATAAGVGVRPNKTKNVKLTGLPIPKTRGKTAEKIAAEKQASADSRKEAFANAEAQRKQDQMGNDFRFLVIAEHNKRKEHIDSLKKRFPKVPSIQSMEYPAINEVAAELASGARPTEAPKPQTERQKEAGYLNQAMLDPNHFDQDKLAIPATDIKPSDSPVNLEHDKASTTVSRGRYGDEAVTQHVYPGGYVKQHAGSITSSPNHSDVLSCPICAFKIPKKFRG